MARRKPHAENPGATTKLKQQFLDGMAPPSVPELDDAAEAYFDSKKERQELSQDEKDKKVSLIEKMVAHGLTRYESRDGLIVDLLSKSNVTCKRKGDSEEEKPDA